MILTRIFTTLAASMVGSMVALGLSGQALAHPGHGHPNLQRGPAHYLLSPMHALPWILGAGVVLLIGLLLARYGFRWRQPVSDCES